MSPILGQAMLSSHDAVARNEIRLNKAGLTPYRGLHQWMQKAMSFVRSLPR
jgi:hypothetical protein